MNMPRTPSPQKLVLIFIAIVILIALGFFAKQSILKTESSATSQTLVDLGASRFPPTSPLYFLKTWRDLITNQFARTPSAKATAAINQAQDRIRETNALAKDQNQSDIPSVLLAYSDLVNDATKLSEGNQSFRLAEIQILMVHVSDLILYYKSLNDTDSKVAFIKTIDRESNRSHILLNKLDAESQQNIQRIIFPRQLETTKFLRSVSVDPQLPLSIISDLQQRFALKDLVGRESIGQLIPKTASSSADTK